VPRATVHIDGNRLRRARDSLGLTQAQLGERVGISQPYVAQIEGGYCVPPVRTLVPVCRALNLSVEFVLVEDEPEVVAS
jgi:transcriptional regulator with XRE-family HTH domain